MESNETTYTLNAADPIPAYDFNFDTLLTPKRLENESFEDYKIRRKVVAARVKDHLKGEVIWNSRENGTYRKKVNA